VAHWFGLGSGCFWISLREIRRQILALNPSTLVSLDLLGAFIRAVAEAFQHAVATAHGERDDGHGGGLVGAVGEDAGVANVEVRGGVGLAPFAGALT